MNKKSLWRKIFGITRFVYKRLKLFEKKSTQTIIKTSRFYRFFQFKYPKYPTIIFNDKAEQSIIRKKRGLYYECLLESTTNNNNHLFSQYSLVKVFSLSTKLFIDFWRKISTLHKLIDGTVSFKLKWAILLYRYFGLAKSRKILNTCFVGGAPKTTAHSFSRGLQDFHINSLFSLLIN